MLAMDKGVLETHDVVVIVLVHATIELENGQDGLSRQGNRCVAQYLPDQERRPPSYSG